MAGTSRESRPTLSGNPAKRSTKLPVVLAREQGGGGDHRHLLPGQRRDECGAQRDLGLAEADIAADQPVHRLALRQIAQHIVNRALLIVGFGPGKAFGELVIARLIGQQHRRLAQGPRRCGLEQFVGDLPDALLQAALAALPGFAAQAVERHQIAIAAIAAEHVDILDRDVELVAAGIGQHHAIVRDWPTGIDCKPS